MVSFQMMIYNFVYDVVVPNKIFFFSCKTPPCSRRDNKKWCFVPLNAIARSILNLARCKNSILGYILKIFHKLIRFFSIQEKKKILFGTTTSYTKLYIIIPIKYNITNYLHKIHSIATIIRQIKNQ